MNRKIIVATLAAGLGCIVAMAQPKAWQKPDSISGARELPRSLALPFDTAEDALSETGSSKYLQTINSDWTRTETAETVTYSARYKRPFAWIDRLMFVYIEGATSAYEVRANGKVVGYNQSSRTPAEFEVTKQSVEGNNTLEITIFKNSAAEKISTTAPQPALLGSVYVISPPKVRIRDWDISSKTDGRTARVELGVALKSGLLNARGVKLFYQLYSPEGKLVTEGHRDAKLEMKGEDTIRFYVEIPQVKPWSHETPNLYTMLFRTQYEGRFTEYVRVKTGVRELHTEDGKLTINGHPLQLSFKELNSIPADIIQAKEQLMALKKEGYNGVRVKNSPQRRQFYTLCDQLGIYVCDQADVNTSASGNSITVGGNPSNDPIWEQSYVDRAKAMYYTSQNHPSVIMFSLGESSANGYNLYESYLTLKEIERTRPIVYLAAAGQWNSDAVSQQNSGGDRHGRVVMLGEPTAKLPEQLVSLAAVDAENGQFTVTNHYTVTPLPLQVRFALKKGRKVVMSGIRELFVEPGTSADVRVPITGAPNGTKLTLELFVERPTQISTDYYITAPVSGKKKFNPVDMFKDSFDIEEKVVVPMDILATGEYTVTSK